jgi:hypothetical protein
MQVGKEPTFESDPEGIEGTSRDQFNRPVAADFREYRPCSLEQLDTLSRRIVVDRELGDFGWEVDGSIHQKCARLDYFAFAPVNERYGLGNSRHGAVHDCHVRNM